MTKERKRIIKIPLLIVAVLMVVAVVVWCVNWIVLPTQKIDDMAYLILSNTGDEPYRVELTAANTHWDLDGILVWNPVDAELVMKDGTSLPVKYDEHYRVFKTNNELLGCYLVSR